jgi:hypothetical protein
MIGAMACSRLRSTCAVAVVFGLLLSLLVLCCCVTGDASAPSGASEGAGVASMRVAQAGVTDAVGRLDLDCGRPTAPDGVVSKSDAHDAALVAGPVVHDDVAAPPAAMPPSTMWLRHPVPHALCVMRT